MTHWDETHTALIHATRYEIRREGDAYVAGVIRRGPIDCYSRTLVDNFYAIHNGTDAAPGPVRVATLEEAKNLCVVHELLHRKHDE